MTSIIPSETIERRILEIRGHRVMLDADLAALYGVTTSNLNLAVKRNIERFPADFMFQLTPEEAEALRLQFATSNDISSDSEPASTKRGGRRYLPYVFTEQGVAMLSSVLRSERAIQVNIGIMRAFVRQREMLAANVELAKRLDEMEKKYDSQFKAVFAAIRQLMSEPEPTSKKIGFRPGPK